MISLRPAKNALYCLLCFLFFIPKTNAKPLPLVWTCAGLFHLKADTEYGIEIAEDRLKSRDAITCFPMNSRINRDSRQKFYQLETIQLLNEVCLEINPPWNIVDVGAGSGQLIHYVYPFSKNYVAIEPSEFMYGGLLDFLNKNKQYNVCPFNLSLESFFKNLDKSEFDLIIANFNVLNYLSYEDLISQIKLINKIKKSKTVIAFDTWSLDFVLTQPETMESSFSFDLVRNSNKLIIERKSNSFFIASKGILEIDFIFNQVFPEKKFLGKEKHKIYPFDINKLHYESYTK